MGADSDRFRAGDLVAEERVQALAFLPKTVGRLGPKVATQAIADRMTAVQAIVVPEVLARVIAAPMAVVLKIAGPMVAAPVIAAPMAVVLAIVALMTAALVIVAPMAVALVIAVQMDAAPEIAVPMAAVRVIVVPGIVVPMGGGGLTGIRGLGSGSFPLPKPWSIAGWNSMPTRTESSPARNF